MHHLVLERSLHLQVLEISSSILLLDVKSNWINTNPSITKSILKITHRNPFISYILFYILVFLSSCLLPFSLSPTEIKSVIRATFKQPTNMTSIFLPIIKREKLPWQHRNRHSWLPRLQSQKDLRYYLSSGVRSHIVLYRISAYNVRQHLKENDDS